MGRHALFLALGSAAAASLVQGAQLRSAANPIRKVVNMLQAMQKKVEQEGKTEEELYEKFMCFCNGGGSDLGASISAAEAKIPEVGSSIDASKGKLAQAKADLKSAQVDRSAAEGAMKEATALRGKEAAAYAKEKAELDTNLPAIRKAVQALEKGMAGSFLQTSAAQVLRALAEGSPDMQDADRQELVAFLSEGSSYAPSGGEITGILKAMDDQMSSHLAELTSAEQEGIKNYEALMAAKKKEVASLSATVEAKTVQIGELGVAIERMKQDLSDTDAQLAEDKKYLADLETSCKTKTAEWQERSKTRGEELVALADTIKILNDDAALEMFKSTLPSSSSSFLQLSTSTAAQRSRALALLRAARSSAASEARPGLDLLLLTLGGRRAAGAGDFAKVIKMIDSMVEVLQREQADDDNKLEYCTTEFDVTEDKTKELKRSISDSENAIADTKEKIATALEEISSLEASIKSLDKAVATATEQRKEENTDFKAFVASNKAAKELLMIAKNRLAKFYNPKMYKAPPKAELSEGDRISANFGGAAALVQLAARRGAPPPPPETWGAYQRKTEESNGVVAMIDLLANDLTKEMTEAETEEKNAQADYEKMMADSAEKRTTDAKSLAETGAAKADMESELEAHTTDKKASTKELMATLEFVGSLHSECDWLVQNHEVRKTARADEVDSLKKAKAVLSGADLALVQTRVRTFLRGSA